MAAIVRIGDLGQALIADGKIGRQVGREGLGARLTQDDKLRASRRRHRLDADVQDEVSRGLEVAEKNPMPPPERALEGVYHGVPRARDGRPRIR